MYRTAVFALGTMCLIVSANCTGINPATHLGVSNTNPAQEYGMIGVYGRRGLFYHNDTVPGQLGNASPVTSGQSCSYSILWLIAIGDSSIESAKQDGGISKVALVEFLENAIGGFLFHKVCTIVRGEK